jgi:cobyrinic acid a,c-diamide synthase
MLAAPKSGSGKTTITCALLQTLKNKGQRVVSYKCGPDYIDTMYHEKVIEIPSKNLDTFFTDENTTRELFLRNRAEEDFAVLEGVMGLYDGLGGIREEGSSYHLAKVTNTPIILVIDAKGMGRSIIPLIAGFLQYDTSYLIKGVILNRMSKAYYDIIKSFIESELQISVIGYFPDQKNLHIESRHLGLVLPNELADIREQLQRASEEFEKTISLDEIIKISEAAEDIEQPPKINTSEIPTIQMPANQMPAIKVHSNVNIAVARDEAFCFYYEDNLLLLQEKGANIKYFSPIHDSKLPEDSNAILLGGGYPELYAEKLCSNTSMCESIRKAFNNKMPIVAECGGFMYLHSEIIDKNGESHPMADVVHASCSYKDKLVRFGYIEIKENHSNFLSQGSKIKGHEFHYYDSTYNGNDCTAIKPITGKEYPCIIEGENYWLGFPHLYYPSNPDFAENFVRKAKIWRN